MITRALIRFYSDIIVSGKDTGDKKLECMWIDANGDQPYTGFQVYWPAYKAEAVDAPLKPIEAYDPEYHSYYPSSYIPHERPSITDIELLVIATTLRFSALKRIKIRIQ